MDLKILLILGLFEPEKFLKLIYLIFSHPLNIFSILVTKLVLKLFISITFNLLQLQNI